MMANRFIPYIYIIWGRAKFINQNGVANKKSLRSADFDKVAGHFW